MNIRRSLAMALLAAYMLTGCLEHHTRIVVNPDGTGTVIQRVLIKKTAVEMIQGMKDALKDSIQQVPDDLKNSIMYNEADMRRKAQDIGEMVIYVSSRALDTADMVGYEAVYAFQDITKIKIDTKVPGSDNKEMTGGFSTNKLQEITGRSMFQFAKGSPSVLTIAALPDSVLKGSGKEKEKVHGAKDASSNNSMAFSMMKTFFGGMQISVVIEPQGTIIETNATYHSANDITILDLDFDKLMTDEKALTNLMEQKPKNRNDIKKLIKTLPGVKVETEKVTVKFQ